MHTPSLRAEASTRRHDSKRKRNETETPTGRLEMRRKIYVSAASGAEA